MPNNLAIILSSAYLPNIQYFSKLLSPSEVFIEVHDRYQKQSYRNRTTIYGANGKQDLVIPVKRPQGNLTFTQDVLLDFDTPWQQNHWKAILSAYKHSPFFDIFEDEMAPLYEQNIKYLLDWNFLLLDSILHMTDITAKYQKSTEYSTNSNNSYLDFRETIHPKARLHKFDPSFEPSTYFQVFSPKHGHLPNLSFIDLLFHEGPQATYLCKSFIKKGNPIELPR